VRFVVSPFGKSSAAQIGDYGGVVHHSARDGFRWLRRSARQPKAAELAGELGRITASRRKPDADAPSVGLMLAQHDAATLAPTVGLTL
jgi:hypothetical protein